MWRASDARPTIGRFKFSNWRQKKRGARVDFTNILPFLVGAGREGMHELRSFVSFSQYDFA